MAIAFLKALHHASPISGGSAVFHHTLSAYIITIPCLPLFALRCSKMFPNVPRRPKWSRITQNDLLLSLPLTLPLCTGILQYQPSIKMKLKDTSSKHITTHLSLKGTKPLLVQRRSSLHACFQHNQFYVLRSWCMISSAQNACTLLYTMKRGLISRWTGQHGSFANQNAKSSCQETTRDSKLFWFRPIFWSQLTSSAKSHIVCQYVYVCV